MERAAEREIFDWAPVGLLYSEDRVILRHNRAFGAMFGYGEGALTGQSLERLYPSREEFAATGKRWEGELARAGTHTDERIMRRADGRLFWCRVRGQALDAAAPLARAVWSFADLSAERTVVDLTARERQVAALLAEGRTAKEIAARLGISPRTVDAHKRHLMEKVGARNSLEAVRRLTALPLGRREE